MEELQKSYLSAIAAAAGCIVGSFNIDDGVDAQLNHRAECHTFSDKTARLEVQMKATHAPPSGSYISATMNQERFQYFRTENLIMSKIVVIMHIPPGQDEWLKATSQSLEIFHCSYWVNLAGCPNSSTERPTVRAPLRQLFDDSALCEIMQRVGRGEQP